MDHLEVAKKEVGRAATITYIESWPARNARKKGIKVGSGDYGWIGQRSGSGLSDLTPATLGQIHF
jgi:hypothetical protein